MNLINVAHAAEESAGLSVHLKPYIVGYIGDIPIASTMITVWVVIVGLILLAILVHSKISSVPGKLQNFFEMIVDFGYKQVLDVLKNEEYANKYFPVIFTIFIFVLSMNWAGLIPGVGSIGYYDEHHHLIPFFYPGATDLNITIGLAIISFVTIEVAGVLAIGVWKYAGKFLNFHSVMGFAIGIMELISELARLISFSFRLFGNIFAGKTLLLVAMFFVPYVLPVPIYAYELFVGIIQALVFSILTLFFIKMAVEEPSH